MSKTPEQKHEDIKYIQEKVGCGIQQAKEAYVLANNDKHLAVGYIMNNGLAVHVKKPGKTAKESYDEWVWMRARAYKERVLNS